DFNDLVRILEEKPEWRAALRRQVLIDELLALPERVATLTEQVTMLTGQMTTLTARVTELVEAQKRTDAQITELAGIARILADGMGEVKGRLLELDYRTKGPAYFGGIIRRAHVLSPDELSAVVANAVQRGTLPD